MLRKRCEQRCRHALSTRKEKVSALSWKMLSMNKQPELLLIKFQDKNYQSQVSIMYLIALTCMDDQILDGFEIDVELHDKIFTNLDTLEVLYDLPSMASQHQESIPSMEDKITQQTSPNSSLPPNPRAQHQLHPLQPLRHHRNEDQGRHPRLVRTSPHLVTAGQWCGGLERKI